MKLLIAALITVTLFSCSVTKNRKAVARVTYNSELFEKVGRQWEVSHPCEVDTVVRFVNGKEIITFDTVYSYSQVHDTIHNVDVQTKTVFVTKQVKIHDTIRVTEKDLRSLNLCSEDLNKKIGENAQLNKSLSETKKESKKWLWLFIGACSVIALENLLWLYNFLRPKMKV